MKHLFLLILSVMSATHPIQSQTKYDESKVPDYDLPLLFPSKKMSRSDWEEYRRSEILELLTREEYGSFPDIPFTLSSEVVKEKVLVLNKKGLLKEVTITISTDNGSLPIHLLIISPANAGQPSPAFLTLNFYGNHTILDDPNISLPTGWVKNKEGIGINENKATEESRGGQHTRWAVEEIIDRGYALATVHYGDIDPDFDDGFQNGLHPLFYEEGQSAPKPSEWGSVAAWSWGLSRVMDYLETDPLINTSKVAVMGHSRLGKAALWAGATDKRFAITISNNSGCGGAALSKRKYGETVGAINLQFTHWFCDNFNKYNEKEETLPFDQHMLLALMAPRAVYVASAKEDQWADPRGEFLSTYHAGQAFALYGLKTFDSPEMPKLEKPVVMGKMGYHIRRGPHNVTDYDWQQYLDFADLIFKDE